MLLPHLVYIKKLAQVTRQRILWEKPMLVKLMQLSDHAGYVCDPSGWYVRCPDLSIG